MNPHRLIAFFLWASAINATAVELPFSLQPESGTWQAGVDDDLLTQRTIVRGERGLSLLPGDKVDFDFTVRFRFDELRYQNRVPACGVAFATRDRRNHAGVVLDTGSSQLRLIRVTDGTITTIAVSAKHALLPVGEWCWLKVRRSGRQLSAALSRDGRQWLASLDAALPADLGAGRVGLIADLPATSFDLAPHPARALRNRGEWVQTTDGTVTAYLREERFSSPSGLIQTPRLVRFAANAEYTDLDGVRLRNPAWPDAAPAAKPSPADPAGSSNPTAHDYLATMHRIAPVLPNDGYRLLGTTLAMEKMPDPAFGIDLLAEVGKVLKRFARSGEVPRGFSAVYPALRALTWARSQQALPKELLVQVPLLAQRTLTVGAYERGPMNRALGMAAAITPGLRLAPEHTDRAALERTRALVIADFAAHAHQPLEDSTNYQLISLLFALTMTLDDPSLGWAQQPGFRSAFDNLCAQVGPDGTVPAYGDDHHSHPGMLIGLFEAAARLWREPRFRGAAALVYARHFGDGKIPAGLVGEDLLGLGLAVAQTDPSIMPALNPPVPALLRRAVDGSPTKLVLGPGGAPGDFTLLFDLLNGTEHGHHDALALVGAMARGHALLPDTGRYARGAQFQNRLVVAATAADFPLRADTGEQTRRMLDPAPPPGLWRTWRLPLRDHWVWGNFAGDLGLPALEREQYHPDIPREFSYDPQREFALLAEVKGEGRARFEFADVRLTGGTQPDRELTGFTGDFATEFTPTSSYLGAVLPGPLDLKSKAYNWLEFRLRVTPEENSTAQVNSIVIGDRDGYPKRYVPSDSPGGPVKVQTWQLTPWGARATLGTDYFTADGSALPVTRRIIYIAGRAAVIRDTITNPTPTALFAGPVWHITGAQLTSGGDCLIAGTGLVLRFAARAGAAITLRQHAITGVDARQIYAQGATLAPGETRSFDTLLLPPLPDETLSAMVQVQLEEQALRLGSGLVIPWEDAP
jgi:hypothetical protein